MLVANEPLSQLESYRIVDLVGESGMAEVYRAQGTPLPSSPHTDVIEHRAKREKVGASIQRFPSSLFRRHAECCTHRYSNGVNPHTVRAKL